MPKASTIKKVSNMDTPAIGQHLTITLESPAHGGESVARVDGMVIFVPRTLPGDTAVVEITQVKKSFARARLVEIVNPGPGRIADTCPAAAHGAGCCDYSFVHPDRELELKKQVLADQIERIAHIADYPEIETIDLAPREGWRTRFRLGVDSEGHAGIYAAQSTDIVTGHVCAQAPQGLFDGIIGDNARTFTPGAEVIVALDSEGNRHVVQTTKAARGRNTRKVVEVLEGSGMPRQQVGEVTFELPATAFWQAHSQAPEAYSKTIREWVREGMDDQAGYVRNAWDLYGGVGMFVPALQQVLRKAVVHSVELSPAAAKVGKKALGGNKAVFHSRDVAAALPHLPKAPVVVLDPPRKGAGAEVISGIASYRPELVVHVGCDPATFARDLKSWAENDYELVKLRLFNAFPGTHHAEAIGLLIHMPTETL